MPLELAYTTRQGLTAARARCHVESVAMIQRVGDAASPTVIVTTALYASAIARDGGKEAVISQDYTLVGAEARKWFPVDVPFNDAAILAGAYAYLRSLPDFVSARDV